MYREFWILEGEATSRSPWPKTIWSLSFGWKSGTQPPHFFSFFPADNRPRPREEPLFLVISSYTPRGILGGICFFPTAVGRDPRSPVPLPSHWFQPSSAPSPLHPQRRSSPISYHFQLTAPTATSPHQNPSQPRPADPAHSISSFLAATLSLGFLAPKTGSHTGVPCSLLKQPSTSLSRLHSAPASPLIATQSSRLTISSDSPSPGQNQRTKGAALPLDQEPLLLYQKRTREGGGSLSWNQRNRCPQQFDLFSCFGNKDAIPGVLVGCRPRTEPRTPFAVSVPPFPISSDPRLSLQPAGLSFLSRRTANSGSNNPAAPTDRQSLVMPPATWNRRRGNKKKTCRDAADMKRRRGRSRSENSERKINCCCVCGCFCRLPPSRKVKRGGSYNRAPVCWFCGRAWEDAPPLFSRPEILLNTVLACKKCSL